MKYKEIRWKNFLSYGNKWTSIPLDTNKSVNIIGSNGKGKSVFLDAFHFVLTGKPFRKIKMGQIPNSINHKNCLVELEFESGSHLYKIKRGINPNIFEIFRNGEALDEESRTSDFQTTLENICCFNAKNLKHTTIMSSMEYKPILKMTASEKRLFIDDLMNVDIFTRIAAFIKKKRSVLNESIIDKEKDIEKYESNLKIIREMNEKAKINNDDEIIEIEKGIEKEKLLINEQMEIALITHKEKIEANIEDEKNSLQDRIVEFEEKNKSEIKELELINNELNESIQNKEQTIEENNNKLITANEKLKKLEEMLDEKKLILEEKRKELEEKIGDYNLRYNNATNEKAVLKNKLSEENEQLQFVKDNVICLRCKREMDESFKETSVFEIKQKIEQLTSELTMNNSEFEILVGYNKSNEEFKLKIKEFEEKVLSLEKSINEIKTIIVEIKNKISNNESLIEDKKTTIEINKKKIIQLQENEELSIENIKLQINNKIEKMKGDLDNDLGDIKNNFSQRLESFVEKEESRIKKLKEPMNMELKDENEILNALLEENKKLEKLQHKKKIFDYSINLSSDKIIKAYVVKKYIPVLNKYLNEYLDILEASYRLKFDENLNEQIVAKGYEKLSYESFSSGERARCDLAILFAFLEVSRIKNSNNSNIIIIDEVADASLDKEGISGILSIISRLKVKGYTIFVISHRDEMKNEFDISYEAKKDVFSELEKI